MIEKRMSIFRPDRYEKRYDKGMLGGFCLLVEWRSEKRRTLHRARLSPRAARRKKGDRQHPSIIPIRLFRGQQRALLCRQR
jgi:hypothetical protein